MCGIYVWYVLFFFLRPHSVAGAPSFTSRGFKYYHLFNMILCGDKYEEAVCSSNISLSTGQSVSNILADETELWSMQSKGEAVRTPVSLLAHSLNTAYLLDEVLWCSLVTPWKVNITSDRVKTIAPEVWPQPDGFHNFFVQFWYSDIILWVLASLFTDPFSHWEVQIVFNFSRNCCHVCL